MRNKIKQILMQLRIKVYEVEDHEFIDLNELIEVLETKKELIKQLIELGIKVWK